MKIRKIGECNCIVATDMMVRVYNDKQRFLGWLKHDCTFHDRAFWEEAPEVVEVDVTPNTEIIAGFGDEPHHRLRLGKKIFADAMPRHHEWRKVEVYWLPHTMEKIKEKWLFTKDSRTFEEHLEQYKTTALKIMSVKDE